MIGTEVGNSRGRRELSAAAGEGEDRTGINKGSRAGVVTVSCTSPSLTW